MTTLRVRIEGVDRVTQRLDSVKRLISEPTGLDQTLTEGGVVITNRIKIRYRAEVDPSGVRWPRSKAAEKRASEGRPGGTLFDTGKLFKGIRTIKTRRLSRTILNRVPYGSVHQFGRKGQVQRIFLGFNSADATVLQEMVHARVEEALRG